MTRRTFLVPATIVASVVLVACEAQRSPPTAPATVTADESGPQASMKQSYAARSGELHVTKECSAYTGMAGSYCTITSSNIKQIQPGSRVVYANAAGATSLDTDVILYPPGPGNNKAYGHVTLNLQTGTGTVTFSGGTGKFTHFHGTAAVSYLGGPNWAWNGTYHFSNER